MSRTYIWQLPGFKLEISLAPKTAAEMLRCIASVMDLMWKETEFIPEIPWKKDEFLPEIPWSRDT